MKQIIVKILGPLILVYLLLGVLILVFGPDQLLYKNVDDKFFDLNINIGLGVQLLVFLYFLYNSCYKNRCVDFKAYIARERKSMENSSLFFKYFGFIFIYAMFFSTPFMISTLITFFSGMIYFNTYSFFVGDKIEKTLYMDYARAHSRIDFAVASPSSDYNLSGYLDALGFDLGDSDNTPYVIYGVDKYSSGKCKVVHVRKAYIYKIIAVKNKYGYFVNDLKRLYDYEYTKKELSTFSCKVEYGRDISR